MSPSWGITPVNEHDGENYQTFPIQATPDGPERVARIAAIIYMYFIDDPTWDLRVNKGSVTLQDKANSHRVVTVFVDFENRLANRMGVQIHEDPLVVAIELNYEVPGVRESIRDYLSNQKYYQDPRQGAPKVQIMPNREHCYDVVFLGRAPCPFEENERLVESILSQIRHIIEKDEEEWLGSMQEIMRE